MYINDLDKKIIYYYRNNFSEKEICKKTGLTIGQIQYRKEKLRKQGLLKKWWEE